MMRNYVVMKGITVTWNRGEGCCCDMGHLDVTPQHNVVCNMFIYVSRNFRSLLQRAMKMSNFCPHIILSVRGET